jgi:hypothetical protein
MQRSGETKVNEKHKSLEDTPPCVCVSRNFYWGNVKNESVMRKSQPTVNGFVVVVVNWQDQASVDEEKMKKKMPRVHFMQ